MYRLLLLLCLCGQAIAQGSLTVGWTPWHPFSFRNEQQQLQGLDIELVEAIFQRANLTPRYVEMPWVRILHEVRFGTVQLAMSANLTAERQQFAHFTMPYREEETVIVIRRQDADTWQAIERLDQLTGRRDFKIGLLKGFDYGSKFRQFMSQPQVKPQLQPLLHQGQLLKLLLAGRIQGMVLDPAGIEELARHNLPIDQLMVLFSIQRTPVHLMLSKRTTTDAELQQLNQAISELKQSLEYQHILDRYLPATLVP